MKKVLIVLGIVVLLIGAAATYWFVFRKDLRGRIAIPYIAHQKPRIDPHVPSAVPIADKLDEVVFDGLFNVSASPSGVVYEDGLGQLIGIDPDENVVTVRLKPSQKWHSSYDMQMEKDEIESIAITPRQEVLFAARDLKFTLERIEKLGSLSPDHILVGQAIPDFSFEGPDMNDEIRFQFKGDRLWTDNDIKEVLSFKILPYNSEMTAANYTTGTGPYLTVGQHEDEAFYHKNPDGAANIANMLLKPFIDNSTYATELRNGNINALLGTPFGAKSPVLQDSTRFFAKPSIATTFFALFYNCQRLDRQQRQALRALVNPRVVMERFFKINTPQQRHIADYRGPGDNYDEHLNFSVFPSTSYYVEEQIVMPPEPLGRPDLSILPDTVRVQTCLNYEFREELGELVDILNDPSVTRGKIKAVAVDNDAIAAGNYDAVLVPVSGYRSNFLFDLYNVFLREPDFGSYRIHLKRAINDEGERTADPASFTASSNFFRLDLTQAGEEQAELQQLLEYVYGFMSTREIGDKQAYAQFIDQLEQSLYLGGWLFSLPSLAYFRTQFKPESIDMYGTASQLSTIEEWQEAPETGLLQKVGL